MTKKYPIAILILLCSTQLIAQISTGHTLVLNLNKFTEIRPKPEATQNLNYSFNTADQLTAGKTTLNAASFQIKSNAKWVVYVQSAGSHFSYKGTAENPMLPTEILQMRNGKNNQIFMPLGATAFAIQNGNPGNFGGENEFSIDYKAVPTLNYPAGNYSVDLVYTVTSL